MYSREEKAWSKEREREVSGGSAGRLFWVGMKSDGLWWKARKLVRMVGDVCRL